LSAEATPQPNGSMLLRVVATVLFGIVLSVITLAGSVLYSRRVVPIQRRDMIAFTSVRGEEYWLCNEYATALYSRTEISLQAWSFDYSPAEWLNYRKNFERVQSTTSKSRFVGVRPRLNSHCTTAVEGILDAYEASGVLVETDARGSRWLAGAVDEFKADGTSVFHFGVVELWGWPFRAGRGIWVGWPGPYSDSWVSADCALSQPIVVRRPITTFDISLPVCMSIHVAGLLANAAVFAAALPASLSVLGYIRRLVRKRRGCCPACGHVLTNLRCAECGHASGQGSSASPSIAA
jgi:hypothetical protein